MCLQYTWLLFNIQGPGKDGIPQLYSAEYGDFHNVRSDLYAD